MKGKSNFLKDGACAKGQHMRTWHPLGKED